MLGPPFATVVAMASIGERIAKRRAELQMTQGELARRVHVSRAAVSQWENGNTKGLKPENLVACADALQISIRELATGRMKAGDPLVERPAISPARALQGSPTLRAGRNMDRALVELLAAITDIEQRLTDEYGAAKVAGVFARFAGDLRRVVKQRQSPQSRRKTAGTAAPRQPTIRYKTA